MSNRKLWTALTFLIGILAPGLTQAMTQEMKFERVSLDAGLSQSSINCIVQDTKGFLWFATQDGLNKYDGYAFTVYKHNPSQPTSISDNFVNTLCVDHEGTLWVGVTTGGLNRFNRETGTFEHWRNSPENPRSLNDSTVAVIFEDRYHGLWIGTVKGLDKFEREQGEFRHWTFDEQDSKIAGFSAINAIYEDANDGFWLGTGGGGLIRFDRVTQKYVRFQFDKVNQNSLSSNTINHISGDAEGNLWVATPNGLNKFNPLTLTVTRYFYDPTRIVGNLQHNVQYSYWAHDGTLWIGTQGGLMLFDPATDSFRRVVHDPGLLTSLSINNIGPVFEDVSGVIWVGTFGGGLNKYDGEREYFQHWLYSGCDRDSFHSNLVWAILEDRSGKVWLGTGGGGLLRIDSKTGVVKQWVNNPEDPASLKHDTVLTIHESSDGRFWLGTFGGGLNVFDPRTGDFSYWLNDPQQNSISSNNVQKILDTGDGVLWLATAGGGLCRFDTVTETFTTYQNDPADSSSIPSNFLTTLYQDHEGMIWLGVNAPVACRFDPLKQEFTIWQNDPTNPQSWPRYGVACIHEDNAYNLWFGTYRGGLVKYNRKMQSFTQYREPDGLPNDVVYGILEDSQGFLWLSTNNGLSKVDPKTTKFRNFNTMDGLQSNEFNSNAYYRGRSGTLYFGGVNGFNSFIPETISESPFTPPIIITSFKSFDQTVKLDVSLTETVRLPYSATFLTFEYVALDYGNPQSIQYSYKLDGFDEDWHWAGTRRYATYTNLPPDDYAFRVRASTGNGVWHQGRAVLNVTIEHPWWQSWWAYLLLVIGAFALLNGLRIYDKNKEIQKTKLRESELRALAAEAQARATEAENQRKTKELEEARSLQLSMLPKSLPQVPYLEIAAYMRTATEVGGDYYDFKVDADGSLIIAIGDATGHGIRAGTMVTSIKSLFTAYASCLEIPEFFTKCSNVIKMLNFDRLYMAMLLLKLESTKFTVSAAGIPPILIFRNATATVEELLLEGLPLGTQETYPYRQLEVGIAEGDVLLLMTDGFLEQTNARHELLNYARTREYFLKSIEPNPQAIIRNLVKLGDAWSNGAPQRDDITFIVVRRKSAAEEETQASNAETIAQGISAC